MPEQATLVVVHTKDSAFTCSVSDLLIQLRLPVADQSCSEAARGLLMAAAKRRRMVFRWRWLRVRVLDDGMWGSSGAGPDLSLVRL